MSLHPTDYFRSERHVYGFCRLRAKKLAMLIHATNRIPLSEKQVIDIEERMFREAIQATSDANVTERVNGVQDAFISETTYRTPSMWKFCRSSAVNLAFRLSLESKKRRGGPPFGIIWRARAARSLCRRMFKVASKATNGEDVNARIGNVYNAALAEHGIAVDV